MRITFAILAGVAITATALGVLGGGSGSDEGNGPNGRVRPPTDKQMITEGVAGNQKGSREPPRRNSFSSPSASFSPDGKRVVIGFGQVTGPYQGPKWKMWDVQTGKEVKTYWRNIDYEKRYPDVPLISYLADGKRILAVEDKGHVKDPLRDIYRIKYWARIWDGEKNETVREFSLGELRASRFSLSRDGTRLLGSEEGTLRLWDVEKGSLIAEAEITRNSLLRATLSPDGKWGIFHYTRSADDPTFLFFYDFDHKKAYHEMKWNAALDKAENGTILPFLISPDGRSVLARNHVRGESGLVLCDARTLRQQKEIHPMRPTQDVRLAAAAAFTPEGRFLLMSDNGHKNQGYSWRLWCRDLKSDENLWFYKDTPEPQLREPGLIVPSAKGDMVLVVGRWILGEETNGAEPAPLAILSARTGEIVTRLDPNVFPYFMLSKPRPNSTDK